MINAGSQYFGQGTAILCVCVCVCVCVSQAQQLVTQLNLSNKR